jgi:hypothetical protein
LKSSAFSIGQATSELGKEHSKESTKSNMSKKPSPRVIKLARALVNPKKPTRDQALLELEEHLQNLTEISDLEMLNMWKALYYCYWFADGKIIQVELAERFSSFIHTMKNNSIVLSYFKSFCIILLREWSCFDHHRVDKFNSLVRIVFRDIFAFLKNAKWETSLVESFCKILTSQILTKQPNGVRYHVCDLYLPELLQVTEGKISTKDFLVLIDPFLAVLVRHDDSAFIERVYKAVFYKFIQELCREWEKKDQEESADEQNYEKHYFSVVNTKQLQKIVFDFSLADTTNDKRLYNLHKEIGNVTGFSSITEDMLNGETKKNKRKKTKKRRTGVSGDLVSESSHTVNFPHSDTPFTTASRKKRKTIEYQNETVDNVQQKYLNILEPQVSSYQLIILRLIRTFLRMTMDLIPLAPFPSKPSSQRLTTSSFISIGTLLLVTIYSNSEQF